MSDILNYVGCPTQIYGVEEHRLVGGKGDGMRLFQIRNNCGLEFTVSADRCADISRMSLKGYNLGYFSPCGYVSPQYYDKDGDGFLKSFTAGFLTTCGLTAVGSPCTDGEEVLPLHGTIANTPADHIYYTQDEDEISVFAEISDAVIFSRKLTLKRKITCKINENTVYISDSVKNNGDKESPIMILYHMNMGYPLLDENAEVYIPSDKVTARNERALEGISEWNTVIPPQNNFEEQCYYHKFNSSNGIAGIFNPKIDKGLSISFDTSELNYFTQWKMMGKRDYVLGLEPGNCNPDGRNVMRKEQTLKFIKPGEEVNFNLKIELYENKNQWNKIK